MAETIYLRSFTDLRAGRERLRERLCFMGKVKICVGRGKELVEGDRLKGQESQRLRWQEGLSSTEKDPRDGAFFL